MPFYHFRQNNSGGYFTRPAHHVYVEADNEEQAVEVFTSIDGVYLDSYRDCSCCGSRWDEYISDTYANEYETLRAIEEEIKDRFSWSVKRDPVPYAFIRSKKKDSVIE